MILLMLPALADGASPDAPSLAFPTLPSNAGTTAVLVFAGLLCIYAVGGPAMGLFVKWAQGVLDKRSAVVASEASCGKNMIAAVRDTIHTEMSAGFASMRPATTDAVAQLQRSVESVERVSRDGTTPIAQAVRDTARDIQTCLQRVEQTHAAVEALDKSVAVVSKDVAVLGAKLGKGS